MVRIEYVYILCIPCFYPNWQSVMGNGCFHVFRGLLALRGVRPVGVWTFVVVVVEGYGHQGPRPCDDKHSVNAVVVFSPHVTLLSTSVTDNTVPV